MHYLISKMHGHGYKAPAVAWARFTGKKISLHRLPSSQGDILKGNTIKEPQTQHFQCMKWSMYFLWTLHLTWVQNEAAESKYQIWTFLLQGVGQTTPLPIFKMNTISAGVEMPAQILSNQGSISKHSVADLWGSTGTSLALGESNIPSQKVLGWVWHNRKSECPRAIFGPSSWGWEPPACFLRRNRFFLCLPPRQGSL